MAWRRSLIAIGLLLTAAALAALAGSLVGDPTAEAPVVEEPQPAVLSAPRIVAEPDHIFDRYRAPEPSPTPSPPIDPPLGSTPFQLIIPSIGVDATVNSFGLDANSIPEVPLNGQEVAWYNWSAEPGTGSNAVLAGHVTWSGTGVFYYLDQLSGGEEILLRSAEGTELSYTVDGTFLIDPSDPAALTMMAPTDDDTITVITCGGTYFPTGGPFGGDYTDRRIVRASLSQVTPVSDAVVASN